MRDFARPSSAAVLQGTAPGKAKLEEADAEEAAEAKMAAGPAAQLAVDESEAEPQTLYVKNLAWKTGAPLGHLPYSQWIVMSGQPLRAGPLPDLRPLRVPCASLAQHAGRPL